MKFSKSIPKAAFSFVMVNLFFALQVYASDPGDLIMMQSLQGPWKFSIGERSEWISPTYNDTDWDVVHVPSPWESQGFYGYNGFGTYRKEFTIPTSHKGKAIYLKMGYIDDVDVTYINGKKVGSTGTFPPKFETAYNAERIYSVPAEYLNYGGKNVITVVVYDVVQDGGIMGGDIGLYTERFAMPLDINLQGEWKFRTGDNLNYRLPQTNDSNWEKQFVPGKWEDQGYRDFDGYGWYRKNFVLYGNFTGEYVILVLGKIDDIDQLYINGELVASTGNFTENQGQFIGTGNEYQAFRGYYIPLALLKKNQENTIALRVFDSGGIGGIYEGPVGIISLPKYINYWRERKGN